MSKEGFWNRIKNFKPSEFDSPDLEGSGFGMDRNFMLMLDRARDLALGDYGINVLYIINSGYRTSSHNKKVGGAKDSSHTKFVAADIRCRNSTERFVIVACLLKVGFTRIGIGKSFVHVDSDPDKIQCVMWDYYPKTRVQRLMNVLGFGEFLKRNK